MTRQIAVIVVASLLLAVAAWIEHHFSLPTYQLLLIYLVPYLLVGYGTICEAVEGLLHGDAFNEHFLMTIATLGALAIAFMPGGESEFAEAVFVMLFFQIGELFEGYAEGRSRDSISHLVALRPDRASVERGGAVVEVRPEEVNVGETIVVRVGERVPIDGVVVEGASALNTVALTGESLPRSVEVGDDVMSGCVNMSGVLRVRTIKAYGESAVNRIIELVEHATDRKSHSETFIARFAHIYTPVVVACAVVLALVPPLVQGDFVGLLPLWLHRALIFLVVSCPCALVISVPLTFFGGIGAASRHGILVKGSSYIDVLSKVDTMVFDKTGTLTRGTFSVVAVHPERCDEQRLLHLAAHVEHYSTHPVAAALREAFPDEATDGCEVAEVVETAGQGVSALVGGERVSVGNSKMMEAMGVAWHDCHEIGTIVHVAIDGVYAGHVVISDSVKEESRAAVERLRSMGVRRMVMLTGDRGEVAEAVAGEVAVDEWHGDLMPSDKLLHVEHLMTGEKSAVAFVGDGINDAPVLARADVGIAMGGLGSEAAIEAADVVLMDDNPSRLPTAIAIARRTLRIARENVWFAIGVKLLVLLLAAVGYATMWMAVFADVGVTVLAVINAMRALRYRE
ncbi:MAG: cadmium-translocating P-type ATPase [Bacteroidales bacterium]|nr:cadmium-translocating P-type ATPase [Bacteroidales bacterium]